PADVAAREATPRPAPAPRETPRVTPRATPRPAGGRIALVIDDLGRRPSDLATIAALGVPVAHAVLPYEPHSAAMAAAAAAAGAEVLLHLPMEALDGEDPGPGALRLGMDDAALAAATRAALAAVPEAVGINNHMGSALSADRRAMAVVLGVARERGLFFLDSRTTAATVGFRLARELGVPAAERQVFLDDSLSAADIEAELERLRALALEEGSAIAIGHPHPVTFAQLAAEVPRAQAAGVRFVRLSELLAR
ncbi:MAG TPA: divergent polysaccharide deacetylase family protein, partial [Thermoanaerobaculia bacterium]|nr:divergent polysaccharide deacetylase family protein [Thermoanaerobaculia bacterium]